MEFDNAKENIQPLAQGRNASILHASLKVDSSQDLLAQRKEFENKIHNYIGDDPLCAWYNYIDWIEQSFPSGGKESGLQEVLLKCLSKFEGDERYNQDRRMIKLYIKFIDGHKDPAECYQQLFNAGFGTMVADFYIAWAYCYDLVGNIRKADEVFHHGIACRAQPLEELKEAHQHFGFSVAQRLMYKDDDSIKKETNRQLSERRLALSSLRGHRRKQIVGSIRTGSAVKSAMPGTVKIDQPTTSSQGGNTRIQVFNDENVSINVASAQTPADATLTSEEGKSVVRSIIDAARNQENQKEPGPWNKAHIHKKGKLFGKSTITNELGFEIHEDGEDMILDDIGKPCIPPIPITDEETKFDKPFICPPNFCAKSKPIRSWATPVTTEERPDINTLPRYNKMKLYPRPNMEFQSEELKAYNYLKKLGVQNNFTYRCDEYWSCGANYNIRLYPHFAKQSKPQKRDALDEPYTPEYFPGLRIDFNQIYNKEDKVERQYEEILALRFKWNETILETTDMEETICTSMDKIARRKSFFPMRKSLAPSAFGASCKNSGMPELIDEKIESVAPSISHSNMDNLPLTNKKCTSIRETSVASKQTESKPKDLLQKEMENKSQSKPFEIFEGDSSRVVKSTIKSNSSDGASTTATFEECFQFKTPALPIANCTTVAGVPNKIPFEIFDDAKLEKNSPNLEPKSDFGCGTGGFFDPEETCSTQTFNIFLKSESVSTPKAIAKSQPQRQFGNILREVIPPSVTEEKDDQQLATPVDSQNYATAALDVFSPPRQQLSTILETSEHGTTQGTHTTGATTKSTFSSPEFDIDKPVQSMAAKTTNTGTNQATTALETVKESSCETSVVSPTHTVDKMMTSLKIQNVTGTNTTQPQNENIATPGCTRLQKKCVGGSGLDFSIFEDTIDKNHKQVGNFSRLEEKEDTAAGAVFKALPPIRFQDDKTETIHKMLMTQQFKFQDDKTETISKMIFAPSMPIQFQEDETMTMSKMLLAPPETIKFPEDKTETISKFLLAPSEPIKFEDEAKMANEVQNQAEVMNQDDSFEFFGQTPPKGSKQFVKKPAERAGPLSQLRTSSAACTPLSYDSKRFCDKNTPDMTKSKVLPKPTAIFEDELQPTKKIDKETAPTKAKNNLKDSFLPDFSMIEDSQPVSAQNKIQLSKSKSVFRDSFIPDFSIIEDSQPQTKPAPPSANQRIDSILPEFSLIENTQPKYANNTLNASLLTDFSHVPETQSNESIIKSSQPTESKYLKSTSMKTALNSTNQKEYSKTYATENRVNDDFHWKQTISTNATTNITKESTSLKKILMDSFMKDFSEIKEPPPVPSEIKEITLIQPSKNNMSLRFLNESLTQKSLNTTAHLSTSSKGSKINFLAQAAPGDISLGKQKKSSNDNNDKYFELNCETEMFGTNISMIKNSTWLPNHGPSAKGTKQLSQIREQSLHIKTEEISTNSTTSSSTLKPQQQQLRNSTQPKLSAIEKSLCNNDFSIEISASELAAINVKKITKPPSPVLEKESTTVNDDCEMSIYYKQTPKTPKATVHIWDDADAFETPANNNFIHNEPDINQTIQTIENICIDDNVNPFDVDLINAFLEHNYFVSYLKSLPTCKLVRCVQRLISNAAIEVNGVHFNVVKLIGEGAYGAVYRGKERRSGRLVAMKQEKPPNCWEYFICLEIQARMTNDDMLAAFMSVDHALIGNNSSILISNFSSYGSIIVVCNKIKKHTLKNVDEYVVMLLASELLEIMDHLHAVNIIHADVKADNFILMNKLSYPPLQRCLQLIDFGVSIDMELFKKGQTFRYVNNENAFKCPEMRENRPWTFQLDLYGLAGVLHVLLFGKHMEIEKKARGIWMHKTHMPRYLNRNLWDEVFTTLLNIRDCNSMPNLQDLRALLKHEMEEKDKYVAKMVAEFNRALVS